MYTKCRVIFSSDPTLVLLVELGFRQHGQELVYRTNINHIAKHVFNIQNVYYCTNYMIADSMVRW